MYWPNWVVLDSEIRANSVGSNLIGELIFKIHGPVGCGGAEERVGWRKTAINGLSALRQVGSKVMSFQ